MPARPGARAPAPDGGAAYGPAFRPPPPATGRRPPTHAEEQVRRAAPGLFPGWYEGALYAGANRRRQHFLDDPVAACGRAVVAEALRENADFARSAYEGRGARAIQGDVRDIASLAGERFDVCFFWHGPEHLAAGEAPGVLEAPGSVTNRLAMLGMPHGVSCQGSEYGSDYERRL